jgi:hypothetical protein
LFQEYDLPKRQHRIQHDSRSADDITDEDLSRVAIFVSDKRYDSFYVSFELNIDDICQWFILLKGSQHFEIVLKVLNVGCI